MRRRAYVWSFGTVLVGVLITCGILRGSGMESFRRERTITVQDTGSWDVNEAFVSAAPYVHAPDGRVAAGIVPHHTLADPLIAAFLRGLSGTHQPKTIVILGPDHGNVGNAYVTTSQFSWSTPDGIVRTDRTFVKTLVERGLADYDEELISHEHGVYAVIPYIAHQFPDALVVTLAIRGDLRSDKLEELAGALSDMLGPDDLLLASVDFSHYKNVEGARTDDARSRSVIAAGDADAAFDIPVDSPPSISLLLRFATRRGLAYQQLVNTNSAEFLHDPTITSTTSYLTAYFTN